MIVTETEKDRAIDPRVVTVAPSGAIVVSLSSVKVFEAVDDMTRWLILNKHEYFHDDLFTRLFELDQPMNFYFFDPVVAVEFKLRFG